MTSSDPSHMDPEPISAQMEELADTAIDYGLEQLGTQGDMVPALFMEDQNNHQVCLLFDDEEIEECLEEAHRVVQEAAKPHAHPEGLHTPAIRYALVYDGVVATEDTQGYVPALLVEYGEHGMNSAYSAYLLYRNAGQPEEFLWTDPAAAGEVNLLV